MTRTVTRRLGVGLHLLLIVWVGFGAFASYYLGPTSQLGWFVFSLCMLLGAVCAALAELMFARVSDQYAREGAQAVVEAWPHVIATLEDFERISPERAETVQVARLELQAHLEQSRRMAAGKAPSWRELMRRGRKS